MQCPYCGRDIPDDARWCPYCGGEQTPPEDDLQNEILPPEDQQDASAPPDDGNGEHFPSGWQDSAPADDWDDEAEPQDDPWADDPPVPGWEDDAPYEPALEDRDAPRSKALLIAIFAALGVALIVLLIALNVKPKPKDPVVAATPAVTATVEPSPRRHRRPPRPRRRAPRRRLPPTATSCRTAPRAGSRRRTWRISPGSSAALPATRFLRATAASSRRRRSRPISRPRAGITARCPARRSITIRSRRPSARTPTSSQITKTPPGGTRTIEHMLHREPPRRFTNEYEKTSAAEAAEVFHAV